MELLKIDLHKILRSRIKGVKGRLIPGFLISGLERIVHQRELNEVLGRTYPSEGTAFADGCYEYFGLDIDAEGLDEIPEGRYVFASNHPLGGLDGIGLVKILGKRYGDDGVRVVVNDMLMNVEPLRNVFLPVNKYGSQARAAMRGLNEAYASDRQIVMFPAGLVSRLGADGKIRDLQWQKSFVTKAIESGRKIVPVTFIGLNRRRFYRLARLRKKLRIGFNIEQIFLPAELCAARGNRYRVIFGKPIDAARLAVSGMTHQQIADFIKEKVNASLPED